MKINNLSFAGTTPKPRFGKDFFKNAEENRQYRQLESMTVRVEPWEMEFIEKSTTPQIIQDNIQRTGKKKITGVLHSIIAKIFRKK